MGQLVEYFLRLGAIGFGGPAALVATMEDDLVERRRWLTREEYLEGLAVCQTLPGPLAIQVGIYVGYVRHGVLGAWAAGGAFIVPPFLIVLACAHLYQRFSALMLALPVTNGDAQPKGTEVTVTGEVVDLWCYLEGGDRGAAHRECATTCAKAGNPIGILDTKGNLYVTAGMQDHQPGRDVLIDKMSQNVSATGTLVKKGGVQMLFVESVK